MNLCDTSTKPDLTLHQAQRTRSDLSALSYLLPSQTGQRSARKPKFRRAFRRRRCAMNPWSSAGPLSPATRHRLSGCSHKLLANPRSAPLPGPREHAGDRWLYMPVRRHGLACNSRSAQADVLLSLAQSQAVDAARGHEGENEILRTTCVCYDQLRASFRACTLQRDYV